LDIARHSQQELDHYETLLFSIFMATFCPNKTSDLKDVNWYSTMIGAIENTIRSLGIVINGDPNCELLLKRLYALTKNDQSGLDKEISQKLENLIKSGVNKSLLALKKEKPLIRIKQLTPKFDDSEDDVEAKEKEEMKKLKKWSVKQRNEP